MDFIISFKKFWVRILDYKGKTSLKEFWWGVLSNSIIMIVLLILLIISLLYSKNTLNNFSISMIVLFSLFCIIELLPSITLIIRRMHDIGKSGFYAFVLFIPVFGLVWYFTLVTKPSNYYSNKF